MDQSLDILLSLGDAVIVTDENHRILAVNKAYERITGYSLHTIQGKKAGILRSRLTPDETYRNMYAALKEEAPWSGIFTNRKRDGSVWHSSITISPFVIEGIRYYVGVFRELEQLERGYYLNEDRVASIQESLLKALAISCEIRDPGIEEHLIRVQQLTSRLTEWHNERANLGLSAREVFRIAHSSILHDIGKSAIPEGILYKPGRLADYERTIIEMHTVIGVDIIDKIYAELNDEIFESELSTAKNIILYHHEKWDGSGYPHKLQNEEIPLEARIVSVVDVYDALTSKRPYKEKWPEEEAVQYLIDNKGLHFDPEIVDSFVTLFDAERQANLNLENAQ